MIDQRVNQLRQRYLEAYGEEITLDEIARYVNGLLIDAQRKELRVFDQLSPKDLIATLAYIAEKNKPEDDYVTIIETVIEDAPKKRGRPKKIA